MSPTAFRYGPYRFFFFSREEKRKHVHVYCADGEAKFWLTPTVELARNHHLTQAQVTAIIRIIEEHKDELIQAWNRHFGP